MALMRCYDTRKKKSQPTSIEVTQNLKSPHYRNEVYKISVGIRAKPDAEVYHGIAMAQGSELGDISTMTVKSYISGDEELDAECSDRNVPMTAHACVLLRVHITDVTPACSLIHQVY